MHVVVVGAGVIGVTTAYYLSKSGYEVTVVDRASEVADGASRGNAGQLSYSFTDALAKPDFLAKIPALLAGRDTGSKMRLVPDLIPWGVQFLAQCTSNRAQRNTIAVLKTALHSAKLLDELRGEVPIEFSHRTAGKLVLLASDEELRSAASNSALKNQYGCDTEILGAGEILCKEPALANVSDPFVGGVYSKDDQVADSRLFTLRLKEWLENSGNVTFRLGTAVKKITKSRNRVRSVHFDEGDLGADAVVVCAGAWSQRLLKAHGVNPQIYPVRGYSVTLPLGEDAPSVSVTALKQRIVFSRLNGCMRIAGFADFKGFSTRDDTKRIGTMIDVAKSYAPLAADYAAEDHHQWGGFRPMTPDGRPRIGATPVDGLFLNTGHGMLGWTLACASGYDVVEIIKSSLH